MSTGKRTLFPYVSYTHKSYYAAGDTLVYTCGSSGATELNIRTGGRKNFLKGIEVSRCFRDDEGNIWFATIGQGVYLLNSEVIRHIDTRASPYDKCSVYSITRYGDTLFAGTNHHVLFSFLLPAPYADHPDTMESMLIGGGALLLPFGQNQRDRRILQNGLGSR